MNKLKQAQQQLQNNQLKKPLETPTRESALASELEQINTKMVGKTKVVLHPATITFDTFSQRIKVHPLNRRNQLALAFRGVDDLVESLQEHGKFSERIVCQYKDGIYYTLDGSRRMAASTKCEMDIEIFYFTEEVSDEDVKDFIKVTDTSKKFSDYERIMMAKEDWEDIQLSIAVSGENDFSQEDFFKERSLPHSRTSFYEIKRIWEHVDIEFLKYGDLNKLVMENLYKISKFIVDLKKINKSVYNDEKLESIFKSAFEEIDNDFGDAWLGVDFIRVLKRQVGAPQVDKPKPITIEVVNNTDCKINFQESGKGWKLTGNSKLPNSIREQISELLKEYYEE